MAASLLRYANREKVAQALTERGYAVTRMTVNRWARGGEMPEIAAHMIGELFGHEDMKASAPAWAEALATKTALAVIEALAPADVRQAAAMVIERLEGTLPPDGGSVPGSGESISPDESKLPKPVRE